MNDQADPAGPRRPYRLFIRERMKRKRLKQKHLAERMKCEPGTVSKLLNGGMKMTTEWLAAFAYALECDVPDLFIDPVAQEKRDAALRAIRDLAIAAE